MVRGPRTRAKVQPNRIQARHFHLTFAALYPGELTFDVIRAAADGWAGERGNLIEWSCGREKHKEPADAERDEHFHIYIHYDVKIDVKNRRTTTIFDLDGQNRRVLHPEVQKVGGTPGDRRVAAQEAAIARRFKCVPVVGPLMASGSAFTAEEMHARRTELAA
jgi:hypothetical protein